MSVGGRDAILNLDFAPGWARKSPGQVLHGAPKDNYADKSPSSPRRSLSRASMRGKPLDRTRGAAPARRPATDRQGKPGQPAVSSAPDRTRHVDRTVSKSRRESDYGKVSTLPLKIRFLPGQKRLAAITRHISASRKSYPLLKLAALFFRLTDYCYVRIESERDTEGAPFYLCKRCKMVALDRLPLTSHIMTAHVEEFFRKEEKLAEAPGGEFVCVARCGLSGILLAPPNHHSYAERIQEIHHSRFPRLSLDEYRKHIETSHDPKLIEQWKEESRKQVLYFPIKLPRKKHGDSVESESAPMKWAEAEAFVEEHIAPNLILETRRAVLPADVAWQIQDERLMRYIKDAWQREKRFPISFSYALRSAFRNMGLHVFATEKRDYVCSIRPCCLTTNHIDPSVREILDYLKAHTRCTRQNFVEALRPGRLMDSSETQELLTNLSWLIEKGHITDFHDGTLALPNVEHQTPKNGQAPVLSAATTKEPGVGIQETELACVCEQADAQAGEDAVGNLLGGSPKKENAK